MYIAIKYTFFALLAIAVNILTQDATLRIYHGPFTLYFSIACGTLTGLLVKYILDKNYIFAHSVDSVIEDSKTFIFYSFMGAFTTLIFWGTELTFEFIFETKTMRYLGAVIGLTIGYTMKYFLDKRYVFVK